MRSDEWEDREERQMKEKVEKLLDAAAFHEALRKARGADDGSDDDDEDE